MKVRTVLIAVSMSATAMVASSLASAKDACKTELCMFGMVATGSNPSKCSGAIKDFFSIVKTKNGHPNASRTFNARKQFIDSCPSGNNGQKKGIMDKFGSSFL